MRKVLCLSAILGALSLLGDVQTVNDVEWTYQQEGVGIVIGSGMMEVPAIPSTTAGQIQVPQRIGKKRVLGIGDWAFYQCAGLTSVDISSGSTRIGAQAFDGCAALEWVFLPDGVTQIGERAFSGCSTMSEVNIPSSVTSIGGGAFAGCSGLGSGVVTIDGCTVTVNGDCPSAVVLPAGTRLIACEVFDGKANLTSVTIPDSVQIIGDCAFRGCGITDVTFPPNLKEIAPQAFTWCPNLSSVTFPAGVTNIGSTAFSYCPRLTTMVLPDGVTAIGAAAFMYCTGLRSITIPASVRQIGRVAFENTCALQTVRFLGAPPEGLSEVGFGNDVPIRYPAALEAEWATVIAACGFTNARPYSEVPELTAEQIGSWVSSDLAGRFAAGHAISAQEYAAQFAARFGSDAAAAFTSETGKVTPDGVRLQVWHDYVAGTDPLNEADVFKATVDFVDGEPVVKWVPELSAEQAALRLYKTFGAQAIEEPWIDITDLSSTERRERGYQFFKVSVEMR